MPLIVTVAPTRPDAGEKVIAAGAKLTVNSVTLVALPPPVVTTILPDVTPAGTVALIWVAEMTVNAAAFPPIVTDVAPVKRVPVIVTTVPMLPWAGVKPVIVGGTSG